MARRGGGGAGGGAGSVVRMLGGGRRSCGGRSESGSERLPQLRTPPQVASRKEH